MVAKRSRFRSRLFRREEAKRTGRMIKRRRITPAQRRNRRTGGFLGVELKFLDCAWNNVTISPSTDGADGEMQPSTGSTNCLSAPANGTGESNKDGRKYVIKSVFFSGVIGSVAQANQADTTDVKGYYFALVLDTQTNKATIVSENVFDNPATSSTAMLPQPLRNLENSKRFKILDSKYVRPGNAYVSTDGTNTGSISIQNSPVVTLSWRGNIVVNTTGTTADVASVADNSIHLIAYAGSSDVTPTLFGKSRVRFVG